MHYQHLAGHKAFPRLTAFHNAPAYAYRVIEEDGGISIAYDGHARYYVNGNAFASWKEARKHKNKLLRRK